MAVVYRATQLSLNRIVALKLLASELSDDPAFRERFRREGQLQAAIDHLHIVPVYEAGQTEHGLFLAMRLIVGSTLKELILGGSLDPRRSLRLLAQAAQALDAAHAAGLIHRDVKPQNILIGERDHVYLADFGLIKAPGEDRLTGTGQFMGTIDYVAPEQIQGEPATAASDCYALAAVLYECLTNQVPFPRPSEAATIHAQIVAVPPRVTDQRPELPAALDEVIASGMAKDPAQRPSSCSELLQKAATAFAAPASRPATPPAQETRISASVTASTEGSQTTRGHRAEPGPAAPAAPAPLADATVLARPPVALTLGSAPAAADQPETTGPARARDRRTRGGVAVALLALAAVAAIVVGFLLGHSGSPRPATEDTNFASVGHLQLRYPSGWQLGAGGPAVPGLSFSDPLIIDAGRATAGVEAGEVLDATGPTLLPAALQSAVGGGLPPAVPVLLGDLQAYRYTGLAIRGLPGTLTIYAVPTSAGVATLACWESPRPPAGFADQCASIAATLRLLGASPYELGPSSDYATLLSSTFSRLRGAVLKPENQLKAARLPSDQANAAAQLATAYGLAAMRLSQATVSPLARDANGALVSALRELAEGSSRAASAARSGNDSAYRAATAQVAGGSSALVAATTGLAKLGYRVAP